VNLENFRNGKASAGKGKATALTRNEIMLRILKNWKIGKIGKIGNVRVGYGNLRN